MTLTLGFEFSSHTYKIEVDNDIIHFNLGFSAVNICMYKPSLGFEF
jgi:hypothetical protein